MEATTTRASMVTRSIPTTETRTHASITMPLSSTRSRTSIRLVPVDGCSSGMWSQYARKQTSCHSRSTAEVGRALLSVKMRAYGSTRGVEFDAEPIDDVSLARRVVRRVRQVVAQRANSLEMSGKFTVVYARQLGDEVIEVGGQCRRYDLAVSDVEQFADVQRRLRAARSITLRKRACPDGYRLRASRLP